MLIYATLVDYLQSQACLDDCPRLRGSDRPILVLEDGEILTRNHNFLIRRDETLYEIGFPWVQIDDWEKQEHFFQEHCIETDSGNQITLVLFDEILDETQISNDEQKVKDLKDKLGDQWFERTTADTIAFFIGLFDNLLGEQKQRSQSECFLLKIPVILKKLSKEEAKLPLVLALNQRYELCHKLELIAPKLRSQLNRTAEMMPLGSIQEMDAYCLRDYVRRPGQNAIEKAGARQELMGIKRYQNFNTPENRFLKGFCDQLHLECLEYREYEEAKRLERAIDRFRQEPSVQAIPRTHNFAGKPNYVLQQNPIYRSFYQAYLDYLKRRTEKENIWGFRQALLGDTVTILLIAALLNLNGSYVDPMASVNILSVAQSGQYLQNHSEGQLAKIYALLQTTILTFKIIKPTHLKFGDLELRVNVQNLTKNLIHSPIEKEEVLKIWIFWFKPNYKTLAVIHQKFPNNALCLYLYKNPNENPNLNLSETKITDEAPFEILQLPDPIRRNLEEGMSCLTNYIYQWCGSLVV